MTPTAFAILVLLFLTGVAIYVELARLPGKKARERGHAQADAISVLSWIGLLLGIVPWVIALVWAYTRPVAALAPAVATTGRAEPKATTTDVAGDQGPGPAGSRNGQDR